MEGTGNLYILESKIAESREKNLRDAMKKILPANRYMKGYELMEKQENRLWWQ